MAFITELNCGDLRQRRAVGTIADLFPDFQSLECIDILLMRLLRLARFDGGLLVLGVALFKRGHQRGINNLTAHRFIIFHTRLVTVSCRSLILLCHLGLECERADIAQI